MKHVFQNSLLHAYNDSSFSQNNLFRVRNGSNFSQNNLLHAYNGSNFSQNNLFRVRKQQSGMVAKYRKRVSDTGRELCNQLNALARVEGPAGYAGLIDRINGGCHHPRAACRRVQRRMVSC